MTASTRSAAASALAGLLVCALVSCGGEEPSTSSEPSGVAASSASGPASAEPAATTSPSSTASASPSPSPPAPSPSPSPPSFPPQAPAVHGGTPTAVYLAVAYEYDDPELDRARARARERGYEPGGGDVGCDQGAREALGLDPARDYATVALYFADRATAEQFVEAYGPGVVGYTQVTTYCLD